MASMKFSLVLLLACTLFLQGVLADIICENLPTNVCAFSVSSSGKRCLLENSITDDRKVEYECKTSEVVVGSSIAEYLETDKCVKACNVDRKSVGMSSDALLEPTFTAKLCSPACYNSCPNIVDLYFNLAAGEGVYLPDLCEKQRTNLRHDMLQSDDAVAPAVDAPIRRNMLQSDGAVAPAVDVLVRRNVLQSDSAIAPAADAPTQHRNPRRVMVELLSSGAAALGPISSDDLIADTPTPSPVRRNMLQSDGAIAPAADAPTQQRNPRRAMVELLSSGDATPSPISSDDLIADTPTPSPFYF